MMEDKVVSISYLLLAVSCGLCWGKLEDYEFQEVDPPVMEKKKFTMPAELLKNLVRDLGARRNQIVSTEEPRVNKHLYKSEKIVTNRFTVYPSDPPLVLCRCWLSKKFPLCDGAHRAHNERNKDNLGPAIISGSKKLNLYMNTSSSAEDTRERAEAKKKL